MTTKTYRTNFDMRAQDNASLALSAVERRLMGVQQAARAMSLAFSSLIVGGATAKFVESIFNAGTKMQQLQVSFAAAAGSAEDGAKNLDFARRISDEMGVSFVDTANAFQKFTAAVKGSSLEGAEAQKIFTSFSGAARVLGLSADDTSGIFLALEQMVSKGRVQAEELRGQLGERLPGAFKLAAEAMGVTTGQLNKMLQVGNVTAEDLLPKLAQKVSEVYGKSIPEASKTAAAELERVKNEWFQTKAEFANSTGALNVASKGLHLLISDLTGLRDILNDISGVSIQDTDPFRVYNASLSKLNDELDRLQRIKREGGDSSEIVSAFGGIPVGSGVPADIDARIAAIKKAQHDILGRMSAERAAREFEAGMFRFSPEKLPPPEIDPKELERRKKEAEDGAEALSKAMNEPLVEAAQAAQDYSDSLIYTYDELGNRVVMTKDEFDELTKKQAEWAAGLEEYRKNLTETLGPMDDLSSAIDAANAGFEGTGDVLDDLADQQKRNEDAARDLGLTFTSAFEDAVTKGEGLRDVLQGIEQDIARIILRQSVTEPAAAGLKGLAGNLVGSLFGGGGSGNPGEDITNEILAGARASGGPVAAGGTYLVGEDGPELLHMGASGSVISNDKLGGTTIHFAPQINIDARSDRADVMAGVNQALRASEARILRSMRYGGVYSPDRVTS